MTLVFIPDLPHKVRLLYGHTRYVDPQGKRVPIHCQRDLAQALGLDPAELSRAINGQSRRATPLATSGATASFDYQISDGSIDSYLPRNTLAKFLRLFDLPAVPETVQAGDEWEKLVVFPIERFCAEVKQRGGRDFLSSSWDLLVASAQREHPQWRQEAGHLTVQSAPAAQWRKTTQPGTGLRFLAKGQPNPAANEVSDLPRHSVGEWARIELAVDDVLRERPLHVLMFQDVVIDADSRRRFIPLLPSPPTEFVMPKPILDQPGAYLYLPREDTHGEAQYFEVPAGWGARRRVTAVVTQKPVAADIYAPAAHGWEIGSARLERLAQRLGHQAYGAWALFTYDYLAPA